MSTVDKTITNAYYEIEIEPVTKVPVTVHVVILTGAKGQTEAKGRQITGGKHVVFHLTYEMSSFGKLPKPKIPPAAQRVLAKS